MKTFKIVVQNQKSTYFPGDTIRGEVIFNTDQDEAVGLVAIMLEGRAKTKLIRHNGNNRRVFRGRAPLLRQQVVLFRSSYTLRANHYSWPFEFTFPETTSSNCGGDAFSDHQSHGVFRNAGEIYPLPPSFSYYGRGWNQGKVEYLLEASLQRP